MAIKTPAENRIEVDMVPLIDIVSLLLMFLVIVGDVTRSSTSVAMKLPRADQAISDTEMAKKNMVKNRIVIQMVPQKSGSGYIARIDNLDYSIMPGGGTQTVLDYLKNQIQKLETTGEIKRGTVGEVVGMPVKLRVPKDAPMFEVERLITTLASAKLVEVHYAADPNPKPE